MILFLWSVFAKELPSLVPPMIRMLVIMKKKPWLTIIGINGDANDTLTHKAIKSIKYAELVMGAERHIKNIKTISNKTFLWPTPFEKGIKELLKFRGKKIVVLVSGNPFWFGAGNKIVEKLDKSEWICFQSSSTFSLVATRMGWAIQNTLCFGLHSLPFESICRHLAPNVKMIVLLKDGESVLKLAEWLTLKNFGRSEFVVMESLGYKNEKIRRTIASEIDFRDINHPVSVAISILGNGDPISLSSGRPDNLFKNDGQITKQPIRALTMSFLAPKPFEHLWDIGSGSGSIAMEWLLSHNSNSVSAIEFKSNRVEQIKFNAKKLGLNNLTIYEDKIENIIEKLAKPDAVFIGGGLTINLLNNIWNIIPKNTKIVVNSVTLETGSILINAQKKYGGELYKFEVSKVGNLGKNRAWSKSYPIIQWVKSK